MSDTQLAVTLILLGLMIILPVSAGVILWQKMVGIWSQDEDKE